MKIIAKPKTLSEFLFLELMLLHLNCNGFLNGVVIGGVDVTNYVKGNIENGLSIFENSYNSYDFILDISLDKQEFQNEKNKMLKLLLN